MKVTCKRGILHDTLSTAATVVPQRTTIPAIMNVKITASKAKSGDTLEIASTDLEYGLRTTLPDVKVKEEGTLVLPAARIAGILRESNDDTITIDSKGNLAHIRTKDSSFKLVGADPADFPSIPSFDTKDAIEISTKDLSEMIRKTAFAVSSEVVRYALTGQLLEVDGKIVRMVSSDGKRLAFIRSRSSGKSSGKKAIRVIVPSKTLGLLDRVLTNDDASVSLNVDDTQLRIQTSRALIFSRLIEGNFPDYEAVIPTDRDKKAVLDREELLSAVRKVSLLTTDKTRAVKFQFEKNLLRLFTRTQDVGEATVELGADYTGKSFDTVYNPDYVVDYLKAVNDEKVEFHFRDKTTAGVFRS